MEFVYVVPRAKLFPAFYPHGLVPFAPAGAELSLSSFEAAIGEHGFFVERAYAERTPELQQIIPYTVVQVGSGEVLLVRRLKKGGEKRLHDKLSIGIGGHIEPADASPDAAPASERARALVAAGTRRELDEELDVRGRTELRAVGILNDDSNPVGAVHVGLVQVLSVDGAATVREDEILQGELVSPRELRRTLAAGADFETWSALLVERLDELLPREVPALR